MPAELHQPATAAPPAQGAMASANAAPSASNDQNRDIFEFFELPRELRDLIYGYAVDEKSALQFADTEFQLRCCDAPCVNFLLVCRQVKLEYMESEYSIQRNTFVMLARILSEALLTAAAAFCSFQQVRTDTRDFRLTTGSGGSLRHQVTP